MAKYRLVTEDALGDPESDARAVLNTVVADGITGKVDKDSIVVNVKDRGATGDGTTDDTAALNAAVAAGAGGTVLVPEGTYMVAGPTSVLLNQPGTHLMLDAGATLKVIPNNLATEYAVVRVTAADCAVTGGTILGDVVGHVGSTGQYGHGIIVREGAHRFTVSRTRLVQHWGDGILIDGTAAGAAAEDVYVVGVVCDDNRRQGMSVTAVKRLQVLGGSFINTGRTLASSPSCGILFEPSGGSRAVVDALVVGAVARNNVGGGFNNNGLNGATDAVFIGCRSVGNATGFSVTENAQTQIVGCKANGNTGNGFTVSPTTSKPVTIEGSVADGNTGYGFQIGGADNGHAVQACQALNNGNSGFIMGRNSSGTGLTAVGNNTATQFFGQITVDNSAGVRLSACVSDVGTNTTKPTRGFRITAGSTDVVLIGCSTRGTFSSGAYSDLGTGTIAFPIPGVAKQTGTPAAATDPATTQTLVNDLRTKLLALGIIA